MQKNKSLKKCPLKIIINERFLFFTSNLFSLFYSGEIDKNTLFDLRAIPYMFLVDKDKKIIKKDLLYNEVSDYLKYFHIID